MKKMNDQWKETDSFGPLDYYIWNGYEDILTEAKMVPPIGYNPLLEKVRDKMSFLADHERKIYCRKGQDFQDYPSQYDDGYDCIAYPEMLYIVPLYSMVDESYEEPVGQAILYIKSLVWKESQSEGCGGRVFDAPFEVYLASSIQDLKDYGIL